MPKLNQQAQRLVDRLIEQADDLHVSVDQVTDGGMFVDCGVQARGGLSAGLKLAQIALSDLAEVRLVPGNVGELSMPLVTVQTDHPVEACLYSQYAGWALSTDDFFGMGSGPIRAAAASEEIFRQHAFKESAAIGVAVVETSQIPAADVFARLAEKARLSPSQVTILAARTASLAGTLQVVARSVETALHKLFELKWDVRRVVSAFGSAPLPPVARNDLEAIGRTNDAILYGGQVHLYVTGDDASIEQVVANVPSSSSAAHGQPFLKVFEDAGRDFYKIDPHLFSPAVIRLHNIETGRTHEAGRLEPGLLCESFGIAPPSA